jgi:hypothetical protein
MIEGMPSLILAPLLGKAKVRIFKFPGKILIASFRDVISLMETLINTGGLALRRCNDHLASLESTVSYRDLAARLNTA